METTGELLLFPVIEEKVSLFSGARKFLKAFEENGGLLTQAMVAQALGVSRARVNQYVERGRLATVSVNGRRYVSVASLELFLTEERKNGVRINGPSRAGITRAALDQTWSE